MAMRWLPDYHKFFKGCLLFVDELVNEFVGQLPDWQCPACKKVVTTQFAWEVHAETCEGYREWLAK